MVSEGPPGRSPEGTKAGYSSRNAISATLINTTDTAAHTLGFVGLTLKSRVVIELLSGS